MPPASLTAAPDDRAAVPSTLSFEPISRATLADRIREELYARVLSGELLPGSRIPSERDLSEQFRVARTSVREALQGLVSIGLIERRGNRSFVAEQLPDVTIDGTAEGRAEFVRQLFETRRTLEVTITELAAARADEAGRAEIATLAAALRPDLSIDEFRQLDRRFHGAIARACGNPLLVEVYSKVRAALTESSGLDTLLWHHRSADVTTIVAEAIDAHTAISAAIAGGDVAAAGAQSRAHLDRIERRILARVG